MAQVPQYCSINKIFSMDFESKSWKWYLVWSVRILHTKANMAARDTIYLQGDTFQNDLSQLEQIYHNILKHWWWNFLRPVGGGRSSPGPPTGQANSPPLSCIRSPGSFISERPGAQVARKEKVIWCTICSSHPECDWGEVNGPNLWNMLTRPDGIYYRNVAEGSCLWNASAEYLLGSLETNLAEIYAFISMNH
jgi:hypothetical protein